MTPGGAPTTPMAVMGFIGAFTALFAATIALTQNDIKRVLAYSTISQLGYMVAALGVGAYAAAAFHLFTHAFFKALLFLGSGSVIHAWSMVCCTPRKRSTLRICSTWAACGTPCR